MIRPNPDLALEKELVSANLHEVIGYTLTIEDLRVREAAIFMRKVHKKIPLKDRIFPIFNPINRSNVSASQGRGFHWKQDASTGQLFYDFYDNTMGRARMISRHFEDTDYVIGELRK